MLKLKKKYPDCDSQASIEKASSTKYEMTSHAQTGLEILEDIPFDYEDWEETANEQTWCIKTLKIWFTLIKDFSEDNEWCNWANMFYKEADFMKEAMSKIEEVADEMAEYIPNTIETFDLNNLDKLLEIEALITHMGGADYIDPDHDDNDSSVCTFMMFVIKDVVEFCGLLPSSASQPTKQFQLAKHKK
eukprot:CAMPEP_0176399216 /NCGR_PEP_ID=MMETSP0126-20121128/46571_1 /TAXON_ID=141414 ORGANISM="Strombidinopsis acuminatum, Strain SPMC142" /NCGR_SAMPLE_ID=MMETSP0126 /ASSEMBLY_ACC=CAM_ASM_000229 /LENGTH=188 /DNA_ID=CAMNT_0017774641 /DNA_START=1253 /DNA_END=1819 /DNA_ORIENTATION=-